MTQPEHTPTQTGSDDVTNQQSSGPPPHLTSFAAFPEEASGQAFGVDVGGSGIKGGIVDLSTGELVGDRFKVATPQPSTPAAVAGGIREVVEHFSWDGPVGVTLPSVVSGEVVRSAANIDKKWIGADPYSALEAELGDRPLSVLNDADAAGMAEDAYGAGKGVKGMIMLLTFGTGIGSAILYHGQLIPNTELGHLEVNGKEAEHQASSKLKDTEELSYPQWAKRVSAVMSTYENLLWPDLFIVGGGISRKAHKWIPHLDVRTDVVPAKLQNTAGIVGAAMAVTARMRV